MKQHRVLIGDCIESMRTLPDKSVQMCVTSPPYYGLRDYGADGQIGLEETPAEFIARLVEVFREVRRVLRDDGTAWVNMGDSYAGSRCGGNKQSITGVGRDESVTAARARRTIASRRRDNEEVPRSDYAVPGCKPKDMMGMPWRLAFALQDDGWYLRQDIIWHKPNPMPESVRDRCTKAHEYIFLLSKSPKYFYDQSAILEPCSPNTHNRLSQDVLAQIGSDRANGGAKSNGNMKAVARKSNGVGWGHGTDGEERARGRIKDNDSMNSALAVMPTERNKRSVWTVPTHSFKGAHFATFPPDLIRPCILAGAPPGGIVLDPFGGAGTTSVVAMEEGRKSILCELNPEYAAMAERRIAAAWLDGAAQMDVFRDTVQHPAA
ncbi:site-specific DNA-methyltransferase [Pseudomonas sp. CBSPBW29]|uniref:DNA-methyltransferase n=1 Tax=Pseudomonas sp. CBS TaxID=2971912 RepID=UPI0021AC2EEA|nr:site-specific DNA-methyltransferase [Pseudomonas sp. CBS]WEL43811.1 site-specific DNA-methyltransferase [Pseudomonas sp. CBSPBW29]WEL64882.1 site-specific DNA-methyltransferase [Pseudomonas sp. CBSPGW29]WEL68348.1 site-specific DNA-methyltransferase [Pseudomonas sp. CBSPCGW29]WEL75372.1 site-specific DNA-methyltransferase [Pseudomonas sp. CBSPAW29]WEL80388.1 site-specific DNA-methyltransferase [Pseudomonas sp. CBSPCAW29]WEL88899.1 site-specific DNA-methyltransferase [Pseudomonas sp. CBSPCB